MTTRADILRVASGEKGYVEQGGSTGHDGNITKYGAWFGMNGAPWCAMFVSWCYAMAGLKLPHMQTDKGYASVYLGEQWFRNMGLWVGPSQGKPADIVIYTFSHTGMLDHYDNNGAWVWEGNTNNAGANDGGEVMLKQRPLSLIKGIGTPQGFTDTQPNQPPVLPDFSKWPGRYLALSTPYMQGNDVKLLQMQLQHLGAKITPDGIFGPQTHDIVRWWQGACHLTQDGIVGSQTWGSIFSH